MCRVWCSRNTVPYHQLPTTYCLPLSTRSLPHLSFNPNAFERLVFAGPLCLLVPALELSC